MTPRPVPALAAVSAYRPPAHPAPIDLPLAGNEGVAPPPALVAELARALDGEALRRYPSAAALEAALAARLGLDPAQVYVTAGGDEAIDRVCRAYLAPGRAMVLPEPSFEMLPRYARLAGAELLEVDWPDGPYPTEAVLARLGPDPAAWRGVLTVVSPNNPTGAVARAADLARLSAAAPQALLLVDLAYAEFADEDLTAAALALPNAVVVRTLSKAWGLAGLRVGFALGAPALLAPLRAAGGPYSVAGPSLALGLAALERVAEGSAGYVARVRREREALRALVHELGVDAPPSQGNFVLLRGVPAAWLRDACAALGIGVRAWFDRPRLAGCVRVTCPGDEAALARLTRALRAALAPEALYVAAEEARAALAPLAPRFSGGVLPGGEAPGWVLTREPGELASARAAGHVALALAPEGDPEPLLRAGAARVLRAPAELERLLEEVRP